MAIKIDLLPGYVALERWRNRSIIASVAVVVLVVSGLLMALDQRNKVLQTLNIDLEAARTQAAITTSVEAETSTLTGATAPLAGTSELMLAMSKTGAERAALLNLVRQYIYPNAVVSNIDLSDGQNVIIDATVRDPEEYRRFLSTLRRGADLNNGPLFENLPGASGVRGFANGAAPFVDPAAPSAGEAPVVIQYPLAVRAQGKLKNPVVLPPDPTTGAAPAAVPGGEFGPEGGPPPGP